MKTVLFTLAVLVSSSAMAGVFVEFSETHPNKVTTCEAVGTLLLNKNLEINTHCGKVALITQQVALDAGLSLGDLQRLVLENKGSTSTVQIKAGIDANGGNVSNVARVGVVTFN